MLEIVFDRLERMLTTSVRNFTSDNVDISLENITAQRFGDYLNSVPLPAMIAVFKAVEWDNYGLITVDSPMIYSIVDVLLGGRRGTAPMRIEGRPYTTIERALVERLIRLVLDDLRPGLRADHADRVPLRAAWRPTRASPRSPGRATAASSFKLRIEMEDRGGTLEFLIPYATLEPVRDLLLQMFMGEKFGRDSIWENHLAREIWVTDVELEAVLEEQTVSLGEVMALKVGSDTAAERAAGYPGHPALRPGADAPGRSGGWGSGWSSRSTSGSPGTRKPMLTLLPDLILGVLLAATSAWCALVHQRLRRLRTERGDDGGLHRVPDGRERARRGGDRGPARGRGRGRARAARAGRRGAPARHRARAHHRERQPRSPAGSRRTSTTASGPSRPRACSASPRHGRSRQAPRRCATRGWAGPRTSRRCPASCDGCSRRSGEAPRRCRRAGRRAAPFAPGRAGRLLLLTVLGCALRGLILLVPSGAGAAPRRSAISRRPRCRRPRWRPRSRRPSPRRPARPRPTAARSTRRRWRRWPTELKAKRARLDAARARPRPARGGAAAGAETASPRR